VGTTSTTWWYCGRMCPPSRMRAGQWTIRGARIPPPWVSFLYHLSGVLLAWAHPVG